MMHLLRITKLSVINYDASFKNDRTWVWPSIEHPQKKTWVDIYKISLLHSLHDEWSKLKRIINALISWCDEILDPVAKNLNHPPKFGPTKFQRKINCK